MRLSCRLERRCILDIRFVSCISEEKKKKKKKGTEKKKERLRVKGRKEGRMEAAGFVFAMALSQSCCVCVR